MQPAHSPEDLRVTAPPLDHDPAHPGPAARSTSLRRPDSLLRLPRVDPAPAGGMFAWLVVAGHAWVLSGLFLDGWYHVNRPEGETFLTPWHAILYSGVVVTLAVQVWQTGRAGGLRPGYGASLAGGPVILLAGAVDGAWHTVLGVEADLAALLSPPHLLLITAGTLVFAGPLRAGLSTPLGAGLPTALSAAFVVTGLGFFTQYVNPITHRYPVREVTDTAGGGDLPSQVAGLLEVAGLAGVIIWSVLVGGALAVVHARTALVPGSLFVVMAVPSLFMTTPRGSYELVPAVLLTALAVELLGRHLPTAVLTGVATGLLTTGWVLSLAATAELAWSLELLTGSIGSAAAAGYLVGWLVQGARTADRSLSVE